MVQPLNLSPSALMSPRTASTSALVPPNTPPGMPVVLDSPSQLSTGMASPSPTSTSFPSAASASLRPHTPPSSGLAPASRTYGPSSGQSAAAAALLLKAVSPPTPAPSPQPFSASQFSSTTSWPSAYDGPRAGEEDLAIAEMRDHFAALSHSGKAKLMMLLVGDCSPSLLSPLLPLIQPRLKRDFLRQLPIELAFHVLSFVDDVRTLARASGVSRFWRALLEDEGTWKRMCWKSGFVTTGAGAKAGGSRTSKIRGLEFGEREVDEQTPAGRERRATLISLGQGAPGSNPLLSATQGMAALALARPPAAPPVPAAATAPMTRTAVRHPTRVGNGAEVDLAAWVSTAPQVASMVAASDLPAPPAAGGVLSTGRRGATGGLWSTSGLGFAGGLPRVDPASRRAAPPLAVTTGAAGTSPVPPTPIPINLTSPTATRAPTSIQEEDEEHPMGRRERHRSLPDAFGPLSTSPDLPSPDDQEKASLPAGAGMAEQGADDDGFSYKTHFKRAYLTESSWLRGPGRTLSTQMTEDEGVVTCMGYDNEWIVVGMASSRIHIFEAGNGNYVKTLDGHEMGVWCLTLVSKGGGPRPTPESSRRQSKAPSSGFGSDFDRPSNEPRRSATMNTDSRLFTNDSPLSNSAFFRHPRADADPISPTRPTHNSRESYGSSSRAQRRRSFHAFGSHGSEGNGANRWDYMSNEPRTGGMGLGAGGETGDSQRQASVCSTARGWGQPGAVVVSGGCDREVRVWDIESGNCIRVLHGHTSTVRCLRVADGRPIAVSGSRDGTLRVWNIDTGVQLHQLVGHEFSVRCLEIHGNKAVSGSYDATCRLWNIDTGECLHVLRGHLHQIYAVAFDGLRIVTGSLDAMVRVWSAQTGECLALLQGHTQLVGQVQIDSASNVVVTGGSDGRVIVYSLDTYECIHRLCAHDNSVTCLQFDDRFLVTGGNDGLVKLWDFKTGAYIRDLSESSDAVWRVNIRDDKSVLLCKREGRTVMEVRSFLPSSEELNGRPI